VSRSTTDSGAQLWSAAMAAAADRETSHRLGLPSAVLMERAALCVCAEVQALARREGAERIVVLCGPGNNGGDGLAVARQLHGRGWRVLAVLVTPQRSADVSLQLDWARRSGVPVAASLAALESGREGRALAEPTIVVDAMLGTGARGAPRGPVAEALGWLDARRSAGASAGPGLWVVAIDLPSGIDVDSGRAWPKAARADLTVTMQRSKLGLHVTPGRLHAGEVVVADIGLREGAGPEDLERWALVSPWATARVLGALPRAAHKGRRGHVGVLGGSAGMGGAAVLAGAAALRAGAGLVTLAAREVQGEGAAALERSVLEARPELMLAQGSSAGRVPAADVLVVGPGMADAVDLERLPLLDAEDPRPMVWDAGALDVVGLQLPSLRVGPRVWTPHPGEAARLMNRIEAQAGGAGTWTSARVQAHRVEVARRLAECGVVVVLKGEGTILACPGSLAVCVFGGPALATAGSGDVLAGVIAAFLARGLDTWEAAQAGVLVHALAGEGLPADGTVAMDVADAIPGVLAELSAAPAAGSWPRALEG